MVSGRQNWARFPRCSRQGIDNGAKLVLKTNLKLLKFFPSNIVNLEIIESLVN